MPADPSPFSRPPTRRGVLLGTGALGAAGLASLGALGLSGPLSLPWRRIDPRTVIALHSETVAIAADGSRALIPAARLAEVLPGTRLLRSAAGSPVAEDAEAFQEGGRPWLEAVPPDLQDLAGSALWDLWVLSHGLPAPVAGWSWNWRRIWPRDAAFCVVALARIGHAPKALAILAHLQVLQGVDGWFEARYMPGTAEAPDRRHRQFDGTGLVLWATSEVVRALPIAERPAALRDLDPLITASRTALLAATADGTGMPAASPDYWEVPEREVTLGIAASTLAGLRAVESLKELRAADRPAGLLATQVAAGVHGAEIPQSHHGTAGPADSPAAGPREPSSPAAAFTRTTARVFAGHGFQRYSRHGGADSARALFAATGSLGLVEAGSLLALHTETGRPAGGIAPGASWREDGISWTPSTSLLALALAQEGQAQGAREILDWIAAHRTAAGSIPEKVLFDGRPAAVAPLAWSAANVLLAIDALSVPARP